MSYKKIVTFQNLWDIAKRVLRVNYKNLKFYKYNPAASESEPEITNFVAAGYEAVADGDWFIVKELDNIVVDEL